MAYATDGSATTFPGEGFSRASYAVLRWNKAADSTTRPPTHRILRRTADDSTPYRAELRAIRAALDDAAANQLATVGGRVLIITDSRSAMDALANFKCDDEDLAHIWTTLRIVPNVHFVFVFSHAGTHANDLADDAAATAATTGEHDGLPLHWADQVAVEQRARAADADAQAACTLHCFAKPQPLVRWWHEAQHLPIAGFRLLAQARSGVLGFFGPDGWQHRTDGTLGKCQRCGKMALGRQGLSVDHVFNCTATDAFDKREALGLGGLSGAHALWRADPKPVVDYLQWYAATYPYLRRIAGAAAGSDSDDDNNGVASATPTQAREQARADAAAQRL